MIALVAGARSAETGHGLGSSDRQNGTDEVRATPQDLDQTRTEGERDDAR